MVLMVLMSCQRMRSICIRLVKREAMPELAGVLVGNYFLLECLAREGMVETYRARPTTRGGYDVILRLFRPEFPDPTSFREHFAAEVEKVWRCHHERIQPLLEFRSEERRVGKEC